ncbi:MAG: hypothetical protein K9L74_04620 [Candidatus Izimaplasma sp.]|nr:hypothetical protein [Candidatus Izimaplasma bacterium]
MRIVKKFQDGTILGFDRGKFDSWCVYLSENGSRYAPTDLEYFDFFRKMGKIFGFKVIYNDFIKVYNLTNNAFDDNVSLLIDQISKNYGKYTLKMSKYLTIIYMGMIAEENKRFTKLGKRIKRLGMYELLIEQKKPFVAANSTKGMKWRQIDNLCKKIGF